MTKPFSILMVCPVSYTHLDVYKRQDCQTTEWPMRLGIDALRPLHTGPRLQLEAFRDQRVHAVAGIGEPERFFTMLRDAGIGVVPHAFPDHYAYTAEDLKFGSPCLLYTSRCV